MLNKIDRGYIFYNQKIASSNDKSSTEYKQCSTCGKLVWLKQEIVIADENGSTIIYQNQCSTCNQIVKKIIKFP